MTHTTHDLREEFEKKIGHGLASNPAYKEEVFSFIENILTTHDQELITSLIEEVGEDEKVKPPTLIGQNYGKGEEPTTYWKAGQNQERQRIRTLLTSRLSNVKNI